jgi:hypothetical protein
MALIDYNLSGLSLSTIVIQLKFPTNRGQHDAPSLIGRAVRNIAEKQKRAKEICGVE